MNARMLQVVQWKLLGEDGPFFDDEWGGESYCQLLDDDLALSLIQISLTLNNDHSTTISLTRLLRPSIQASQLISFSNEPDRKSTRLNSSHVLRSRMPSSA